MSDEHEPGGRDPRDEALRAAFGELRARDEATAPPFASLWGRPARPARSWLWWAMPLGAALAAVVLLVVWLGLPAPRPPGPPPRLVGVREPEPLAFLLVRPSSGGAP